MISNLIIKRTQALSQIAYKTFFYNLNYLPDTILGGIILFALLLQSPPLLVLGVLDVSFVYNLFKAVSVGLSPVGSYP